MNPSAVLKQLPAVFAGVLAGLFGAYFFAAQATAAVSVPTAASSNVAVHAASTPASVAISPFVPENPPAQAVVRSPVSARERPAPANAEAARREVEERAARDLAAHERDSRDPAWARAAEGSLAETLRNAPGRELVGVECKMTTCVASLAWPSQADARNDYHQLLLLPYQPNCSTRIILPEASDPAGRYETKLFFDCTDARASK